MLQKKSFDFEFEGVCTYCIWRQANDYVASMFKSSFINPKILTQGDHFLRFVGTNYKGIFNVKWIVLVPINMKVSILGIGAIYG